MKREKELAEKRKNDPPLELSHDHPVRKLISRFRKISDRNTNHNLDPERGEQRPNNLPALTERVNIDSDNDTVKVTENNSPASLPNATRNNTGAKSRWGSMLGGRADAAPANNVNALQPSQANKPAPQKNQRAAAAAPPKPKASKWGKLLSGKQEPIEERVEEEEAAKNDKSNLHKTESNDSGMARSDARLDQAGDDAPLTQRDIVCSVPAGGASGGGALTPAEQQLIASLYDIKLEIKEDIESLNQKMTRIDDQIGDILKLFTPHSSPYCSHTPSSLSSRVHSSQDNSSSCSSSTDSHSVATDSHSAATTSPRHSLPPSPHHRHHPSHHTHHTHHPHHPHPTHSTHSTHHAEDIPMATLDNTNEIQGARPRGSRVVQPPVRYTKKLTEETSLDSTPSMEAASPPPPDSRKGSPSPPGPQSPIDPAGSGIPSSAGSGSSTHDSDTPRKAYKRRKTGSRKRVAPSMEEHSPPGTVSPTTPPTATSPTSPMTTPPTATSPSDSSPAATSPTQDDENTHIKDRDLDIL